ncbi:MAG TPA: hypothetical protein VJX16_19305 [Terriglobales bacterium]|nr:hypothetical protein [Terriglobales bacterium]
MRRIALWGTIVLLGGVCLWLLAAHSNDLLPILQPGLLVLEVRSPTMILEQTNRRYTVSCETRCGIFVTGKKYPMRKRGSILEYRRKGETITLPILQEQIFFPTQPGGLG